MTLNVAELRDLRDELVRARAAGVRELRDQSGETIIYKSDRELAGAIASIEFEIARMTTTRPHTILFRTSKFGD